ncbi:hypothetical protein [Hydrogenothermus marinus]|uniref:STT3/PglB/AglB core domain-containing protein n=1 Tax=Hydrogenothermus marinus TaxID=133270 RepID=A0A3M0B9Z2_9AQUI|nr:hypothetical protein [Hydrogenothermus marinus]RMA93294.1 hypothetical protein CLV39_1356 [Hydrogenothermus marinus]
MNKNKLMFLIISISFSIVYFFKFRFLIEFIEKYKDYVITGADAFYYARKAKELLENSPNLTIDYLKNVPDFSISFVNFHSYIAYILAKYLHIDLNTIFLLFPPLFAPLFVIPLLSLLKDITKDKELFLFFIPSVTILGSLNIIYAGRTQLGRFDTDFLILFFLFGIYLFVYKLIKNLENIKSVLINLTIIFILYKLFMWHYPKNVFSLMFLFSFVITSFYIYKTKLIKNLKINFLFSLLFFALIMNNELIGSVLSIYKYFTSYIFKITQPSFLPASVSISISELQGLTLKQVINITTDNILAFIIAIFGLILFFYRYKTFFLLLFPVFALGLTSFGSNRFMMYLAPFIGIGVGYGVYIFYSFLKDRFLNTDFLKNTTFTFLLFITFLFSTPPNAFLLIPRPLFSEGIYKSTLEANKYLKEDSYIWAWWDYGLAIQYLLNKGTFTDNGNFNQIKMYSFANSMYTTNPKRTYKLISYLTNKGTKNLIKKNNLINIKIDEYLNLVDNYKEKPKKDVYIFIYGRDLHSDFIPMIGFAGTKIQKFQLPLVKSFYKCMEKDNLIKCPTFSYNLENNTFLVKNQNISQVIFVDREKRIHKKVNFLYELSNKNQTNLINDKNLVLEIIKTKDNKYYELLVSDIFINTMIDKMFVKANKFKNFQLVYDNFPNLVVYKIK